MSCLPKYIQQFSSRPGLPAPCLCDGGPGASICVSLVPTSRSITPDPRHLRGESVQLCVSFYAPPVGVRYTSACTQSPLALGVQSPYIKVALIRQVKSSSYSQISDLIAIYAHMSIRSRRWRVACMTLCRVRNHKVFCHFPSSSRLRTTRGSPSAPFHSPFLYGVTPVA